MRDRVIPNFVNPNYFYSPADGIVTFAEKVKPNDKLINVKGQKYTLLDLMMCDEEDLDYEEYMVMSIFMTLYDCHVNRISYPGYLKFEELDSIMYINGYRFIIHNII